MQPAALPAWMSLFVSPINKTSFGSTLKYLHAFNTISGLGLPFDTSSAVTIISKYFPISKFLRICTVQSLGVFVIIPFL